MSAETKLDLDAIEARARWARSSSEDLAIVQNDVPALIARVRELEAALESAVAEERKACAAAIAMLRVTHFSSFEDRTVAATCEQAIRSRGKAQE